MFKILTLKVWHGSPLIHLLVFYIFSLIVVYLIHCLEVAAVASVHVEKFVFAKVLMYFEVFAVELVIYRCVFRYFLFELFCFNFICLAHNLNVGL